MHPKQVTVNSTFALNSPHSPMPRLQILVSHAAFSKFEGLEVVQLEIRETAWSLLQFKRIGGRLTPGAPLWSILHVTGTGRGFFAFWLEMAS